MPNELDHVFRTLLSDVNRDIMKPRGWMRDGQNFRLIQKNGIVTNGMIVNFQRSQWNSSNELRFTINAARKMAVAREIGPKFKEYECHFSDRKRPQNLSPAYKLDQWWSITSLTDYESLKGEIEAFLEEYAIPWLMG